VSRRFLPLFVLVAVALSGCFGDDDGVGSARKGGSVTLAWGAPADSLDPATSNAPATQEALWLVYTPPVTYRRSAGKQGSQLVPGVARGLPEISPDGRTYRFTVRRGLRYSNGERLRASDFRRTIERVLVLNRRARRLFEGIVGARAYESTRRPEELRGIRADDHTGRVTIQLARPDGGFLDALATTFAGLVPQRTPLRDQSASPPPGIGPYAIARRPDRSRFAMRRVRRFSLPSVPAGNVDEIDVRSVPDRAQQARGVIGGRYDYAQAPPPARLLPELRSTYGDRFMEHPTLVTAALRLDRRRPPFEDPRVRRAVAYALDAQKVVRLSLGRLQPTCNLLPPDLQGQRSLDPCPFGARSAAPDLVRARSLVEDAPSRGAGVTVWSRPGARRIARYFASTLRKIGLRARYRGGRRQGAQAQIRLLEGELPRPAPYLGGDLPRPLRRAVAHLEREPRPGLAADEWARLERTVVEEAFLVPYGTLTATTFLSARVDAENCARYHPMFGNDYSSLCLK
jgi:peptide/nickel transport system substrate-binding protein